MAAFELGKLKLGEVCKMYNISFENLLGELNSVILKNPTKNKL